MKFRLEAEIGAGAERYRLQKDYSWRQIDPNNTGISSSFNSGDDFNVNDFWFDDLDQVAAYATSATQVELDNIAYVTRRPGRGGNGRENLADLSAKVCRLTKPRRFSQSELTSVIATGDDNQVNVLALDLLGYFKLVEPQEARDQYAPLAVISEEFFSACGGHIGYEAAQDKRIMREYYFSMLEGWNRHLHTDMLGLTQDTLLPRKSEAELWKEVEMLTKHLK